MEILNRKARYDYEIEDTYEAGIVLTGTEIKSIRQGKANIKEKSTRSNPYTLFSISFISSIVLPVILEI